MAFVYSKTGTAEMATDPMTPNVSDTFILFKDKSQWMTETELDRLIAQKQEDTEKLNPHAGLETHARGDAGCRHAEEPELKIEGHKGKLIKLIQLTVAGVPGNNDEFTQPIQMRINEPISGVRADVAVKVYGDDFDSMEKTAQRVLATLQGIPGADDAKVEQTEGLPVMTVDIDRAAIARYGLAVHDVLEVVAVAMGGREAGQVFEGDRRFDLVVRLPDAPRGRIDTIESLPIPLPKPVDDSSGVRVVSASTSPTAGLGGTGKTEQMGFVPLGQWLAWGGQFENLLAAKARLSVVVPVCFFLIFLLLFSAFSAPWRFPSQRRSDSSPSRASRSSTGWSWCRSSTSSAARVGP